MNAYPDNFASHQFTYRAQVKSHCGWQKFDRARFGISVGKEYHEGEKLKAALDWALPRFKYIEVRVSDTLQRYNLAGGDTPWNHLISRQAGDAWLARNSHILEKVSGLHLFRWDDVLNDPNFLASQALIDARLQSDPTFLAAVEEDVAAYAGRTGRDLEICRAFVREELAVFNLLQDCRPAAEVYPGSFLHSRHALRGDFNSTRINFVRVKPRSDIAA